MKVDTTIINLPQTAGRSDLQAGSGQGGSNAMDSRLRGNDNDTVALAAASAVNATRQQSAQKTASSDSVISEKGVIALDDDKNVVIRFYDDKGKVVRQYPPEDYLEMMKKLGKTVESLFSKKA